MNNGGPAFPIPPIDNGPGNIKSQAKPGMTLRDWFAGMAMQGILVENSEGAGTATFNWRQRAEAAYKAADAMLKAREAEG